ncbi:hypothetical protein ACRAWD_04365 [Caulobacter segnis]
MGALIASRVGLASVCRLDAPPPRVLVRVGGFRAPHIRSRLDGASRLDDDAFAALIGSLGGTPREVLENKAIDGPCAAGSARRRADRRILPVRGRAASGHADHAFRRRGGRQRLARSARRLGRSDLTALPLTTRMFLGGHFFVTALPGRCGRYGGALSDGHGRLGARASSGQ